MKGKPRILVVTPSLSSFIVKDIEALRHHYKVSVLVFHSYPKWKAAFEFVRHKVILLFTLFRYHLVICQFAGYHSYFPVLFGKWFRVPALIICGGTESVSFPSIRYGNFHKKLLGFFTAYSLKNATHLAPKHQSLIEYEYNYDDTQPRRQGIKAFVKNFNTPFTVIPNGYDGAYFYSEGEKTPRSLLTVAAGIELPFTIPLKGIDLILKVAPHFPDCTFTIAGCPEKYHPPVQLPNVSWVHIKDQQHLLSLYRQHQFYMQFSMSEGFPNAICEAMLCECIPIASCVNALPDIVGNAGFLFRHRHESEAAAAIEKALHSNHAELSIRARNAILHSYPLASRIDKLLKLVAQLIASSA
jgi:glycosyltransferase involved in cell wall biosynthesis